MGREVLEGLRVAHSPGKLGGNLAPKYPSNTVDLMASPQLKLTTIPNSGQGKRRWTYFFPFHLSHRNVIPSDIIVLKHDSSILRQSSNPVCGLSMMEQVRLCAVWPTENWLTSSMNHIHKVTILISREYRGGKGAEGEAPIFLPIFCCASPRWGAQTQLSRGLNPTSPSLPFPPV